LQNSISFLQEQHQEILSKLHEEIEKLKSENKGFVSFTTSPIYIITKSNAKKFALLYCLKPNHLRTQTKHVLRYKTSNETSLGRLADQMFHQNKMLFL
jgi:K+ transporter